MMVWGLHSKRELRHVGFGAVLAVAFSGTTLAQDALPDQAEKPEAAAIEATGGKTENWPAELVDPAATGTGEDGAAEPADLLLPMPCGAGMAFQKVAVPADVEDPLADRRLRLGQSLDRTGYSDYLRPAFLRGAFTDSDTGGTFYYIARYELTRGQRRALAGDCTAPSRLDRLAQGGLSWFDAVELARDYSSWLMSNARDSLPVEDGAPAFLRLPTGEEWEYAARGGARIDATQFPGQLFFGDGDLRDYARFQAPGSARGKLGPVGLRKPNPLGLFDVYGNAEELVLGPFRLNAIGRLGGQTGGVVTRGGSVLSTSDQIYSAQRTEYPPYDPQTGEETRAETFGLRLVLSAPIITSDARLRAIQDRWDDLASGEPGTEADGNAGDRLAALIEGETDPRRLAALEGVQHDTRQARERTQTALQQAARSTLLSGAVFVGAINDNAADIEAKAASIRMLVDLQKAGDKTPVFQRQLDKHVEGIARLRGLQSAYLLSFRAALETLGTDIPGPDRRVAHDVLREELSLSGRTGLLPLLDRFWQDLAAFEKHPDMDPEALLTQALE